MKGASVSFMVKDILNDTVVFSYDAERELIPASVLKTVTTASALEILGEQFRYGTDILYDGIIQDGILEGNIYIRGSGDPTLGSYETGADRDKVLREWVRSIKSAGIRTITGSVIADERVFDTEGISMKMMREDMGSYYGQGSYGINIFDNRYTLFLRTNSSDVQPEIIKTEPEIPSIQFHNYLTTNNSNKDSMYITGFPFSNERMLYGTVPSHRFDYQQKGDIPDPALFLAQYLSKLLEKDSILLAGTPTSYRRNIQNNNFVNQDYKTIITTYSESLKEIVRITNHKSHNLYADALLKTVGLSSDLHLSSFENGVQVVKKKWDDKGINTSSLWMYDGCGLATTDKLTAAFLCDMLSYMYTKSPVSKIFVESLPRTGVEGTVANFLRGSKLHGKARLKSGSMSRVRSYAGYVMDDNKTYAIAIIVNNFSCTQAQIRMDIERLVLSLF